MSGYSPEFVTTSGRERGPDDLCIVSCGIGPEYQEALHSTRLHCEVNVPDSWRLFYRDYPEGCPPHDQQQYAFKIYAIKRAILAGFRFVLWIDSSFQPIGPIDPLMDVLRTKGWYVPRQQDAKLGNWCSDEFINKIGAKLPGDLTPARDVLMTVPLVYSGIVGFHMNNPEARGIWESWHGTWMSGCWNGPHKNTPGLSLKPWRMWGVKWEGYCSDDPRCEGHRHDEAALSWVLKARGCVPDEPNFLTLSDYRGFIGHHVPLITPGRVQPA